MQKLLNELDGLQEETDRSSFGSPATQGEIEAYEDNKERILELVHEVMPYLRSLEADHRVMREAHEQIGASNGTVVSGTGIHFGEIPWQAKVSQQALSSLLVKE